MSVQLLAGEIRNRIVEVKRMRFGDVQPHSRNPKRHPDNQRAAFRGSVNELGFASVPIAYHNADGILTWADGHLRGSEVADYIGDVAITDFTDDEVSKFLLYADPIAAMAEYESQQLDSLLRDVQTGDEALQAMLAGLAETAALYPDATNGTTGDGSDVAPEEARKTLAERFIIPPFSVLDARQGYWQERKRAWIALGIQSELGRGENALGLSDQAREDGLNHYRNGHGGAKDMAMHDSANFPTPLASKRSYDKKRA